MIIGWLFILLLQSHSVWLLENDLLQSLEKAMTCTHREPPREPVMAMTPKKYSQLVALIRKNLDTPSCNKNKPMPIFDIHNEHSWSFCVFGKCQNSECHCLRPYTGFNCASYKGKCWIMYCFLSGCHPAHQSMTCKCDPQLYGTRVLTGDYWYDTGKRNTFEYPPSGWRDDVANPPSSAVSVYDSNGQTNVVFGDQDYVVIGQTGTFGEGKGHRGQSPKLIESGKKMSSGKKHEWQKPPPGNSRNRPQTNPSKSISENERLLQNGQPQRLPMKKYGNKNSDQNSKTSLDSGRSEVLQEDTTEDLKEALEEVERENSATIINDRNAFYIVMTLYVLVRFINFINK